MTKFHRIFLGVLVAVIGSCKPQPSQVLDAARDAPPSFFSVKDFFDEEIQRLQNLQPKAKKTLNIGDKTEAKENLVLDFATELAAFRDSDINRPSWIDQYTVDSLRDASGSLTLLRYQARDSSLYTRFLQLTVDKDGRVSTCSIRNRLTNLISDFRQSLFYDPKAGYTITVLQGLGDDARQPVELVVKFE